MYLGSRLPVDFQVSTYPEVGTHEHAPLTVVPGIMGIVSRNDNQMIVRCRQDGYSVSPIRSLVAAAWAMLYEYHEPGACRSHPKSQPLIDGSTALSMYFTVDQIFRIAPELQAK